ncbi:MAG: family 1 extracellular solute-binding protein [Paenibacillus sp.]|jgi:ABC-type glycerol-3-phosphate transport system substrate-binding protein|uniref:extracellular solute-binding protein n=1 Tax=Paenibacillus sp. GCM10012303 TaxID=3317340 RepID=UPI0029E88B03|nr:family 1 extracellular solute-binding protein [Paenibacillus sp.]
MNKSQLSKKWPAAIAAVLLAGTIASACSGGKGTEGDDTPAPVGDPKAKERIELSMFYNNSGLEHFPLDTTDPSNNPFLHIVEQIANVDLKVEVPPYKDYQTKFNLLLSSGKLPDLLHTNYPDPTYKAARDGAFIDLKPYYDKSPIVQKYITPQMMELAKDPISGKYWRIPMAYDKGPQGAGIFARYDLVEKYNGGKWPETVEDWVELLRKIKKAEPDAIPMSNRVIGDTMFAYGGAVFFQLYGANPYGSRIQGGKVIPNVVLPEYKAAVELMRSLYAEGLFDKEFATTDTTKWSTKWLNNNVLFQWNTADQILPGLAANMTTGTDVQKKYKFVFAPPLTKYPSVLADKKYATPGLGLPISTHGLYIPASSKNKDRAWDVIEAFASEQLKEEIFWGKEGETYTMKDGKRVPIAEKLGAKERTWSKHLAFIFGFTDGQDAQNALYELQIGTPLFNQVRSSMNVLQNDAQKIGLAAIPGYAEPDEVVKKNSEMWQAVNKFTSEAIMGRITMDQFVKEVQDWEKKYRTLKYEPLQKYIDANKESLRKLGYTMVDW